MAASNLRQTILKKTSKIYKLTFFFKMARDGKWLRVVADGCNQLQPLAATCSGSHLVATWQPLGSHLQPLADSCSKWLPRGCQVAAWASGCKWLTFRKSKWCTFARSLSNLVGRKQGWDEAFAGSRWQRAFQPCLAARGNPCPCFRVGNPHGNHHPSLDNYHCHC